MRADRRSPQAPAAVRATFTAAVAVLFLVVVIAAAAQGRPSITPWFPWEILDLPQPSLPVDEEITAPPEPVPGDPLEVDPGQDPTLGLITALVIAVVVLIVLTALVGSLARMRAAARTSEAPVDPAPMGGAAAPGGFDAPEVRRGIDVALTELAAHREPREAIIAAWVGLEQTATDAGLARRASETSSEFAARLLGRTGAEAEVADLLDRYERVRFGGQTPTEAERDAARRDLARIREAWR